MEIFVIDIETIPNQSLPIECIPTFDSSVVKTGNMGEEKAQAKIAKERDKFEKALVKKMSVNPVLCQVCAFSSILYETENNKIIDKINMVNDEFQCVYHAWDSISKYCDEMTPLVTYNGINFDIPVLIFRAMALKIPIPFITKKLLRKYRSDIHCDLMQLLANWDREKWKSLEFYINLFGLGKKQGHGSEIYAWWQNKEFDKIIAHCKEDVRLTLELFKRVSPWMI